MKQFLLDAFEKGDIQLVLDTLKKKFKNDKRMMEVLLLSSKYNELTEQSRLGTIDSGTAGISKSKIMVSVLGLVNEIEGEIEKNPQRFSEPDPISFNINNEEGIQVKFRSDTLKRTDDIVIPRGITIKELIEALLLNYNIIEMIAEGKSYTDVQYAMIINHIKYNGNQNELVKNVPIKEGDLLMIKGRIIRSFIGQGF